MDFHLGEEQLAIRDTTRRYVGERILPTIQVREEAAAVNGPPPGLEAERAGLFDMGFGGMLLPEADGGLGLDHLSFSLAIAELGSVDPSLAMQISNHNTLGVSWIWRALPPMRDRWLPRLVTGQALASWVRADDKHQPLMAATVPGGYHLDGMKRMVTAGAFGDLLLVNASLYGQRIVLAIPGNTAGLERVLEPTSLGLRGAGISRLTFADVRVEADARLDEHLDGEALREIRATASLGWASIALGQMEGALSLARTYASQRVQFGRTIDSFEAIRFKQVDMLAKCEATRSLVWRAAAAADEGNIPEFGRLADLARLTGAEGAAFCGRECVQIHGGYGYSREYHAERFMRDSRGMELVGGGLESLREQIADRWIEG